ncbi:dienelactone hydrolase family protein [Streptomyces malaysiensis]|uniref:dienelactone hydrolase family protein n=1 Tax=Streptomyces malaysiensis TaxID=92644 RepID=UPI00369F1547
MTTITTRTVEYPADGLTMTGHLALPAGVDRRPAVLLGPEGMGLSDVERRRADALAELGYIAPAFDLHGGRYLGDPEEMPARCMPLLADPDRMRGIGHAALDVFRRDEQEMFVLCLRILQSALVYVNTLMLQDILGEPEWTNLLTPADRRGLTPLFWSHLRPYGEVNLDMDTRLKLTAVTVPGPRAPDSQAAQPTVENS